MNATCKAVAFADANAWDAGRISSRAWRYQTDIYLPSQCSRSCRGYFGRSCSFPDKQLIFEVEFRAKWKEKAEIPIKYFYATKPVEMSKGMALLRNSMFGIVLKNAFEQEFLNDFRHGECNATPSLASLPLESQ